MTIAEAAEGEFSSSVALLAPTAADASIASRVLQEAHVPVSVHRELGALIEVVEQGAAAVVLVYECLASPEHVRLERALAAQPPWSQVPVIVLMPRRTKLTQAHARLRSLRHATLLERPVTLLAFLSTIRAALQTRRRQYEIRDLLKAAQRASHERARLHSEALEARALAERANRMKDEFLAVVSHELRTPLNAILGWTTLLSRGMLDAARSAQAIETIERNARVQAQLIEDLLDVSRIISGTLRLDVQPVELIQVIEQAIATVAPAAEAKGLRFIRTFDAQAGSIRGDPARLQQVIWNLLSNAVKFTPNEGSIFIVLERIDSRIEIRIRDTGRGIPAEFLPLIFERFRQIDSSTTRTFGGLGLGLSIVRHLVELHGGTVSASSPGEGQGTMFTVSLPLTSVRPRLEQPPREPTRRTGASELPPGTLAGIRVLAIDDDPDSLRVLATALEQFGAEVLVRQSASEGLLALGTRDVDVVICDIGMPREDGYGFIRKLREMEKEAGRWRPAIALTAYARPDDRQRTIAAGFQVHVAKPADPMEIGALVASLARTGIRQR